MKQNSRTYQRLLATLAGVSLAGSLTVMAQVPTQYMSSFDSDISALTGTGGNIGASTVNPPVWSAQNAPDGPPGGSLQVQVDWPASGAGAWEECQLSFNCNIDLTAWLDVEFDVKVDKANSYPDQNGGYGQVAGICNGCNGQPGWTWLGNGVVANITTNGGWQHFKFSTAAYVGTPQQFVVDFYNNGCTNTIVYLVDNLSVTKAPVPPPTLSTLAPPSTPGLTFMPCTSSQWQRVMVMPNYNTLGSQMGWFGEVNAATYTFTVKDFPKNNDYAINVFWVPNGEMEYTPTDTSLDWNCTNYLGFNITANTTDPATNWNVSFSTKTNLNAGNPNQTWMSFDYPVIPNGKWTIQFNQNTNFTIVAPNGFTTNGSITADVADLVSGNAHGNTAMTVYYGVMNRAFNNINVPCVFSGIGLTNSVLSLGDDFSKGFDGTQWLKLTDYAPDIFVNTNDLMGFLSWNTPNDTGFGNLLVAGFANGPWMDMGSYSTNWLLVQTTPPIREAFVSKSAVHAALGGKENLAAYFRLSKRVGSKLQILLPGETAAPGTPTGKTGTPTPQGVGFAFPVTINLVDQNWNPIGHGTDTIHLTSSDPTAVADPDLPMVNGTITMNIYFGTAGNFTVTASDVTVTTITSDTSSSVAAQ